MNTEIIIRSLGEILSPLTQCQQRYLIYILNGTSIKDAFRLANLGATDVDKVWLPSDIKEIESYLLENKEQYKKEALQLYFENLGIKGQMVIEELLEMGLDWKHLKQGDKSYVMKAVELVTKGSGEFKLKPESYDEMILKMRRKV